MPDSGVRAASRRQFLRFLASSPLYASVGAALAEGLEVPARLPDPVAWAPRDLSHPIADPKEAIN
jgi:hypothetical protein